MKGKSIFTNAYKHKNKNLVLNIDLANFFDSINFGRVRGYFIHNREFALSDKVSSIIAQIVCYDNKLPQGSPCSPVISNLIAQILDVKLSALAKNIIAIIPDMLMILHSLRIKIYFLRQ